MRNFNVVGIGELLWDMLPEGKQLGGAPTNFSIFASRFGANSVVVSSIGKDLLGREIISYFQSNGLNTDYISIVDKPTGVVKVDLDDKGVPSYEIVGDVAWDYVSWNSKLETLAQEADAVCFGSLGQRNSCSKQTVKQLIQNTKPGCLKIFDINLRQAFYTKELIYESLRLANIFKVNNDEFEMLSVWLNMSGSVFDQLKQLLDKFQLDIIALTRGENGSLLIDKNEIVSCPAKKVEIVDTVGAGDAFTAAMTFGLLSNLPLENVNAFANKIGSFVCTQNGATPQLLDGLIDEYKAILQ